MKVSEICQKLNLEFEGEDREFLRLNSLKEANKDEASFLQKDKFLNLLEKTKAGVVILEKKFISYAPKNITLILSENPYLDFARATYFFKKDLYSSKYKEPFVDKSANIHKNAVISNNTTIKANVIIMAGVFIGENVVVEEGSIIHPNVVIYNDTLIGKNCHILANAVVGSDGFGYAHTKDGKHVKIYHNGNVVLEDEVEIGANTTIDRAVFGSTLIKKGTKIDNLVQIGHNCELGENCIIVSQTGISGSSKLGRNVVMGGQSGTSGHISIGDFVQIAARGGVSKSLEGGKTYGGFPILLQKDWLKLQAKILKFFKQN